MQIRTHHNASFCQIDRAVRVNDDALQVVVILLLPKRPVKQVHGLRMHLFLMAQPLCSGPRSWAPGDGAAGRPLGVHKSPGVHITHPGALVQLCTDHFTKYL